jgi:hypothetical protein
VRRGFFGEHHQDEILWSTRSSTNGPEVLPVRSEWGQPSFLCNLLIDAAENYDVIFHGRSEAGAVESGFPDTLEENLVDLDVALLFVVEALHQEAEEITGGLEEDLAVFNCDVINHVPWVLIRVSRIHYYGMKENSP